MSEARTIWPETGLTRWEEKPREITYAWIDRHGSHIGLHLAADHEDCFVIFVSETSTLDSVGYIVFDIGAEYRPVTYVCPSAQFEGPANEQVIRDSIPTLNRHRDAFAILDQGAGTYMQVHQGTDGNYELEHQLVTVNNHYRAVGSLGSDQTIAAFTSYAFGKKEWTTDFKWERVALETY